MDLFIGVVRRFNVVYSLWNQNPQNATTTLCGAVWVSCVGVLLLLCFFSELALHREPAENDSFQFAEFLIVCGVDIDDIVDALDGCGAFGFGCIDGCFSFGLFASEDVSDVHVFLGSLSVLIFFDFILTIRRRYGILFIPPSGWCGASYIIALVGELCKGFFFMLRWAVPEIRRSMR